MIRQTPYRYIPIVSDIYRRLKRNWRRWRYAGQAVFCPVCATSFNGWVGGQADGQCPYCGSLTRQKIIALYLQEFFQAVPGPLRTLLFAPDWGIERWLRGQAHVDLVTTDLSAPHVDLLLDITRIDQPEQSFDLILCSHVMEHVPNDHAALSELYRILRPGGQLLVQVPFGFDRETTYEDWSITDSAAREDAFGQFDHVRVYGHDLPNRIAEAGFRVEMRLPARDLGPGLSRRYGLFDDALFLCHRAE